MKLTSLRTVCLDLQRPKPLSEPRRRSWNHTAPRALPINKYPEFSSQLGRLPGMGGQVWVQAVAEDGTFGLGVCTFGEPVADIIDGLFSPLLEGRDCMATEFLNDLMWRATQRPGVAGHSAVAISGVDLALWDLKGKILGVPVYSLLGGPCRDQIDLYATGDDLDWAMELGFKAFKVTNSVHYDSGTRGLNQLEEKLSAARDTIGADADLMLNAVMSYNVEFAVQVAERLRPLNMR